MHETTEKAIVVEDERFNKLCGELDEIKARYSDNEEFQSMKQCSTTALIWRASNTKKSDRSGMICKSFPGSVFEFKSSYDGRSDYRGRSYDAQFLPPRKQGDERIHLANNVKMWFAGLYVAQIPPSIFGRTKTTYLHSACVSGQAEVCRMWRMCFRAWRVHSIANHQPAWRTERERRIDLLFISHDLSVVRYISDRICVMYLGNVVELADAETIFKDPRHPYTIALLSSIPTTDIESLEKSAFVGRQHSEPH